MGCFWLETTIIIRIESHPFYPIICAWFRWGESKKKNQNGRLKKTDINLFYKPKNQSLKFWRENRGIWLFWKSQFFWVCHFDLIFFFFYFIHIIIRGRLWDRMDGTQLLWLLWFPAKNNPPQTFLWGVYIRAFKIDSLQKY